MIREKYRLNPLTTFNKITQKRKKKNNRQQNEDQFCDIYFTNN